MLVSRGSEVGEKSLKEPADESYAEIALPWAGQRSDVVHYCRGFELCIHETKILRKQKCMEMFVIKALMLFVQVIHMSVARFIIVHIQAQRCVSTITCSFVHLAANTAPKLVLCLMLVRKKYRNGDRTKNVRNTGL